MNPRIFYNNLCIQGTLSATDTASGHSVYNVADWRPYTRWKAANASGTKYISLTLGSAKKANCFIIMGHNLSGCEITLQYHNGTAWVNLTTITSPTNNDDIIYNFSSSSNGETRTQFRIAIEYISEAPEIGILFIGEYLEMPYPPDAPYPRYESKVQMKSEISQSGNLLGRVYKYEMIKMNSTFSNLDRTWVNNNIYPYYNNHAKYGYPFFFAFDLNVFTKDIFLCNLVDDYTFAPSIKYLGYYESISFQLEGRSK